MHLKHRWEQLKEQVWAGAGRSSGEPRGSARRTGRAKTEGTDGDTCLQSTLTEARFSFSVASSSECWKEEKPPSEHKFYVNTS